MAGDFGNITHPADESLARAMFVAEMGHTGMVWEHLGDIGVSEWLRKAGRVLESLYDPSRPFVVIDLKDGELWLSDIGYRAGVLHRHPR